MVLCSTAPHTHALYPLLASTQCLVPTQTAHFAHVYHPRGKLRSFKHTQTVPSVYITTPCADVDLSTWAPIWLPFNHPRTLSIKRTYIVSVSHAHHPRANLHLQPRGNSHFLASTYIEHGVLAHYPSSARTPSGRSHLSCILSPAPTHTLPPIQARHPSRACTS